jgi:peptidyl-prolyl cis-trans isomerase C
MSRSSLRSLAFAALAVLALGAAPALAQQDKVLARVNGESITEKDVETAIADVTAEYPNLNPEQQKTLTLDFLIEMKVAAQKAKAEKMDQGEDFKRRLSYVRERVLMQELLNKAAKDGVTDAKLKAFYDEQVKQIKPVDEVRARHILVESEDEAKKIAERLKKGEDFGKIAKESSKDPGSGADGGDLGYFTKDRMVPEFAEAAFNLKKDEVSAPVKSQFGWHVIQLVDKRVKPVPAFDQVKDRIAAGMAGKVQGEYLKTLRDAAKIEKLGEAKPAEAKPAEKK